MFSDLNEIGLKTLISNAMQQKKKREDFKRASKYF